MLLNRHKISEFGLFLDEPNNRKSDFLIPGVISFLVFFFSFSPAFGLSIPERLAYDLTWTGVKAGTATLEIRPGEGGDSIISTAKSADWVSVFYTVDDRIEVQLSRPAPPGIVGLPLHYHIRIREGRHRRNKEVAFDQPRRKAFYSDLIDKEKKEIDLKNDVFDALSSFYYVRTLTLEVGKSVFVDVLDSKKLWNVEVQVLRKEKITTNLGTFDTVVIKPLMKSEGIFNRKGDLYIWLTDDAGRLPVKMQTKVAVGHITATLVSVDR